MATFTTLCVSANGARNNLSPKVGASQCKSIGGSSVAHVAWWRTDLISGNGYSMFLAADTLGVIEGNVTKEGSIMPYAAVHLYYRPNGMLLAKTFSDSNGHYRFNNLQRGTSDYFAVAYLTPYNAMVFDRLTPI